MRMKSLVRVIQKYDDTEEPYASCYHWSMALGGYDYGFCISYKNQDIIRVNYRYREYEWLNGDFHLTKGEKKFIKKALHCSAFSECEF